MNRTYYYIDYRATIDAIKWRVYLMNKNVQGNTIPAEERKEWFCRRCKSEWTQIEVLDRWDAVSGFLCHKCGFVLTHDPENNRGGHEQSTKYHAQFRFITDLLPKLDEVVIPENKFENAMASRLEVERDDTNPASQTAPITNANAKPTTVHGMKNAGPTSIAVTLTTEDGPTAAELAAEQAQKENIALQNAMPVHFTHSTITGEQVKFNNQPAFPTSSSLDIDKKTTDFDSNSANGDSTEMDEYFARLKAEQAKEAEREQDEEYETDDEEEEDFEDVVPTTTGSGIGTPSSSMGELKSTGIGLTGVLKRSQSAISSGTSTGNNSPMTGPDTPNSDARLAKKVRIEEPPEPVVKAEDEESEEDMEFEDV